MAASQRMKIANEKASKTVTMRGNVPKSSVSDFRILTSWKFNRYLDSNQVSSSCHLDFLNWLFIQYFCVNKVFVISLFPICLDLMTRLF